MNVISIRRQIEEPGEPYPPRVEDQGDRIRRLVGSILRRWRIVFPTAIAVFALVCSSALLSPRIYTASALVMVNPSREQVLAQDQLIENAAPNSSVVDSEIEVLRSPMVMRRLVDELGLEQDPEWNAALRPPGPLDAVLGPIREAVGRLDPRRAAAQADPGDSRSLRNNVAAAVARAVAVRRRGLSFGIEVSVDSQDPRRAAELANTLVEIYLQSQTEARFDAAQRAKDWLSERLEELRLEVQQREVAAEQFRLQHGLSLAAGGEPGQGQSSEVQTMLVEARADLAEKEARLRQVRELMRAGGSADSIASALNSSVIVGLRTQEAERARRFAELQLRYSDEHPAVQAASAELQNIRQRIEEEVRRITANLSNEVDVARARLYTLQRNFGAATGGRDESNDAVIPYRELVRQAAAASAVHESFLQRFHEVADQGELPLATSRLVSAAAAPGAPSKPSLRSAALFALLLGAVAGLAMGLLAETLDGSMGTAEDVARKVGVPAVASVPVLRRGDYRTLPKFRRNPPSYLVDKPMSAFAEALRVLRTAILHARLDKKVRVLAVTSAVPNEGKTTMSLCLARVAAMSGQKVLLIDCDVRRCSMNEILGIEPEFGLMEVLSGEVDWRGALERDPDSAAHVLPAIASDFSPKDMFSSQPMRTLIEEVRDVYDLVILDCAPVLAIAETRIVVTHADVVTLVARSDKTPAAALRTALREVQNAGAEILGVALNYVDPRRPGRTAYGDTLYYQYARDGYYRS